jgi:anoctamin-10
MSESGEAKPGAIPTMLEQTGTPAHVPGTPMTPDLTGIPIKPQLKPAIEQEPEKLNEETTVMKTAFKEMRPDYAISVQLSGNKETDVTNVEKLATALLNNGLYVQVRQGTPGKLLVLVKCSVQKLEDRALNSIVSDWLREIPTRIDEEDVSAGHFEPSKSLSPSDKLRLIHDLITDKDNGAGIHPKCGNWTFVECIFPLHDNNLNKEWIKRLSTQWFINDDELDFIRRQFGEKIALYFGFLQFYFVWSVVPTVVGIITQQVWGEYSAIYAVISLVWGIVFVQGWQRRQLQLSIRWGVRGSSAIEIRRFQFEPEKVIPDAITGAPRPFYPGWKRILTQLSFIPFAIVSVLLLTAFQTAVFCIEIFITQVYNGPFKDYLAFLPTVLLVGITPQLNALYTVVVNWLNRLENHETEESYELSYTQKQFVFNFFVSYMALFLTAYVYLPFSHLIIPHMDFIRSTVCRVSGRDIEIADTFQFDPWRLHQQVVYFAITAQVIAFLTETVVPYVRRMVFRHAKKLTSGEVVYDDSPDEAKFLDEVRQQVESPEYDVQEDYRQLVVQFGYTMLFSPVWAYSPLAASINLWFQLRGDAAKICLDSRRPIPRRAETIGPWASNLSFLTWLASLTCSSIISMFGLSARDELSEKSSGLSHVSCTPWTLLAVILVSEHLYFAIRGLISRFFLTVPTVEELDDSKRKYEIRKRYLANEPFMAAAKVKPVDSSVEREWRIISSDVIMEQIKKALIPPKTIKQKKNE